MRNLSSSSNSFRPLRPTLRRLAVLSLLAVSSFAVAAGCSKDSSPTAPDLPEDMAVFRLRACFGPTADGETFQIVTRDPRVIHEATAQLGGAPRKIVTGAVVAGDGGFNRGWNWHLAPEDVRFVDASIELCDGCPRHLERDPQRWIQDVGRFCPWTTEVIARER